MKVEPVSAGVAAAPQPPAPTTALTTDDELPTAWIRNVVAIGPRRPIWGDVILGIQVGGLLAAGLVPSCTSRNTRSVRSRPPTRTFSSGSASTSPRSLGTMVILGSFFGLMY